MFKGKQVICTHGHISTPIHFRGYAANLIALRNPGGDDLKIPEAAMQEAMSRHLKMLDERNIDIQLISPRPVAMMHWERPFIQEKWARTTNDTIALQCSMEKRFVGIAQLPQTAGLNIKKCVAELDYAVKELGFVGATLNPDPAGDRQSPGLDDEAWYALYEKAEELDATLVVHPSVSKDPRIERLSHSYQYNNLTEETLATLLLEQGSVFERFPKLRIVICHCGGALRRLQASGEAYDACLPLDAPGNKIGVSGQDSGGQVGTGRVKRVKKPRPDLRNNLFFDTCAYDPWFLGAAIHQRGPAQMVFGSEVPGSGSAQQNPFTGKPSDDVVATINQFDFLTDEQRMDIYHNNPRKVFPLMEKLGLF
jgi:predicted TIM-barrel fold metal-dependent hydrolase